MAKLDHKLTAAIQDWLNAPEKDRDVAAGAEMLLKLNRNFALFNSVVRNPEKYGAKIAYELRKYLRIRLHGMAVSDVVELEAAVMPKAEALINDIAIATDAELPQARVAVGKRPDHDSLPPEIRDIYEQNGMRYRKITLLFNELKAMGDAEPCDRFEKLKILEETEAEYRRQWARYDAYVPGMEDEEAADAERKKRLSAARKTLSKYRAAYEKASDPEKRQAAVEKIKAAAATVKECGGEFADETRYALKEMGVEL